MKKYKKEESKVYLLTQMFHTVKIKQKFLFSYHCCIKRQDYFSFNFSKTYALDLSVYCISVFYWSLLHSKQENQNTIMNSKLNIIVVIIKVLQKPLSNQFNYVGCQPHACFSPSLDDPNVKEEMYQVVLYFRYYLSSWWKEKYYPLHQGIKTSRKYLKIILKITLELYTYILIKDTSFM